MFSWFRRRRSAPTEARRLRSREELSESAKVDLAELAPGVIPYLGLVAYLELEVYQATSRAAADAPDLVAKEILSNAAGMALNKHQEFAAEIRRRHREPAVVMQPYAAAIDRFVDRVTPANWNELLLLVYLCGGLFDDFFSQLARGVTDPFGDTAAEILSGESGRAGVATLLERAIRENPRTGDRLALWGRRLVGDSLLVARASLVLSDNEVNDEKKIEPVFTELISTHIKRMDGLGLTA
ncbi:ferritin-like fold-containing protein [Klugiella xanthotipulae]|uniref:tRNA-(MS[2]IO[6]A)-hydroxylase MiaE-like protein n=1 Tax=Klugiella xanthotipulae TaxID=244735 RepID=A0A543HRQ1_9MICO|nr:ferritin-like fold-containing protein [Klugiella xanthotipulae]TQM61026.1 tRNA-(MS[2]IO[6]A)-hydroxylase MiaE-like protein [Klugiella xanthotipulae]